MSKVCIELDAGEIVHIAEFIFGELYSNLYGAHAIERDISQSARVVAKYREQRSEHDEEMQCHLDHDAKLLARLAPFLSKCEVAHA